MTAEFKEKKVEQLEKEKADINYELALCYRLGKNGEARDTQEAIHHYKLAANAGHAQAQYELAGLLEDKNNPHAIYWYHQAAEKNHPNALYELANIYSFGRPGLAAANFKHAVLLYKKALEFGHTNKWHEKVNVKLSIFIKGLNTLTFDKHNPHACYVLAYCFENGIGTPKIALQMSDNLFQQAYRQENGVETNRNIFQAMISYQKAAQMGHKCADIQLKRLVSHCKEYVEMGDQQAQNVMAMCYRDGVGVSQDLPKAIENFQRASAQGYSEASDNLQALLNERPHLSTPVARPVALPERKDRGDTTSSHAATAAGLFAHPTVSGIPMRAGADAKANAKDPIGRRDRSKSSPT